MENGILAGMARLSKSRIMNALQCTRRVRLEHQHPELAEVSDAAQAVFATGHAVGELAVALYGGEGGHFIDYGEDLGDALRETRQRMGATPRRPIFEATLEHQGVLVREDVLLPAGEGWRVIEIKATTSLKPQHLQDCAIQAWVHRGAGHRLEGIALGHLDREFVYAGDGDYRGLITEVDLSREVEELQPSVPTWVAQARDALAGAAPDPGVGQHCYQPYECPFVGHCWPADAEYPVQGLKGMRKRLGDWVARGYRDLREVPVDELRGQQLRIARVTRSGKPEIDPAAGRFMRALDYPRYYLDFETVAPAIPVWPDTRPYEALAVQYSCHIERRAGELDHREFLDLSGSAPMRALAEQLIDDLGTHGPVLMFTPYERGVILALAERCRELGPALRAIADRLVDLHPVIREAYYHPDMLGSWSIKAVLPTIAPDLDYTTLAGVSEGQAASAAFLRAIDPGTDAGERERLRQELLEYCRRDTEGMVRLVEFFAAH